LSRYLIDTHILLWLSADPQRIRPKTLALLQDANNDVYVSMASLWEILIKYSIGKLSLNRPPAQLIPELLKELDLKLLPINLDHVLHLSKLERHHQDPFDHLIVAQSLVEVMPVISADKKLARYLSNVTINE
jgi:PIN domain nuclease of toxin-antitoxin system